MRLRRQGPARGRGPLQCVVSWCFLRRSWRSCEALGREEREVQGGLTVQEPLGDVATGGGRVLEAVTAETDGERSEEHTSELQSPCNLVCRLLLEKKKKEIKTTRMQK